MAMTESPTFGRLLRHYRLLAGLSQEAPAERAQLSTRAVSALDLYINQVPRAATLALLDDALALSDQARAALVAPAQQDAWATRQAVGLTPAEPNPLMPRVGRAQELALLDGHGGGVPVTPASAGRRAGHRQVALARWGGAPRRRGTVAHPAGGCTRRGGQEPYAPLLGALCVVGRNRELSGRLSRKNE
jgi:hypothetical protein